MNILDDKPHKLRLGKRAWLEIVGLSVLLIFSATQWQIIKTAGITVAGSELLYVGLAILLYWTLLPISSLSFQILTKKKLPILTVSLAQAAGSGPGRIIPGGLGRISILSIHLSKLGITFKKSVLINLANSSIGFVVNGVAVLFLVVRNDELRASLGDSLSRLPIFLTVISGLLVFTLLHWLLHARKAKKTIVEIKRQWKGLWKNVLRKPKNMAYLVAIALSIMLLNLLILLLSSKAIGFYIEPTDAFVALSIGVLAGGLLPTPGGIGGVEAGLAGVLIVLGYDTEQATSVALLYRFITYFQPLVPGLLSYLYLREKKLI